MRETRVAKFNDANGDVPGVVKRRGIERRVVMIVLLCVDVLLVVWNEHHTCESFDGNTVPIYRRQARGDWV